MGDQINVLLDDILALVNRIYALPLAFQITICIMINLILWLTSFKVLGFFKKPIERNTKTWIFMSSCLLSISVSIASAWEYKNHMNELNSSQNNILLQLSKDNKQNLPSDSINRIKITKPIGELGMLKSIEMHNKDGIEIVQLQAEKRKAVAYVARFSLNDYEPVLDLSLLPI